MITVKDLIWIVVYFVLILILLILIRPIFVLRRNPLTGQPMEEISGGKLIGWTLLFTIIVALIVLLVRGSHGHDEIII